jgi:hypothetical protein
MVDGCSGCFKFLTVFPIIPITQILKKPFVEVLSQPVLVGPFNRHGTYLVIWIFASGSRASIVSSLAAASAKWKGMKMRPVGHGTAMPMVKHTTC